MSAELKGADARSRRHVIRIAALMGVSAAVTLGATRAARATGRHSDPDYCEPVCLVRGSRIETAIGEVAIENVHAGDLIRTANGDFKAVRWVGYRTYKKRSDATWPASVDPVLVQASALAPGVPSRDLFLSPKHALFLDGYLIPVKFLINGVTIRQEAYAENVLEYFHVECDDHTVMFAERLPVETFRLQDHYEAFANFADHVRQFGDGLPPVEPYAPVLGYWTLRDDLIGLLRSLGSTCVDIRDPIQVAYDRIMARAADLAAEPVNG